MKPKKIRAVIIDDELFARENLKLLITEHCTNIEIVGEGDGLESALKVITACSPDLVFLDIRMPSGAEGFELLDMIPNKTFKVIFITAFKDYAIKAFKSNAIDYLLKPVDIDELQEAVNKLANFNNTSNIDFENYLERLKTLTKEMVIKKEKIAISHQKGIKIVYQKDIIRLNAEGNCTMLYFINGNHFLDTRTLKVYENLLDHNLFYRIHKSHIINLNYITDYINENGSVVKLKNGDEIPISRSKISEFTSLLKSNQ